MLIMIFYICMYIDESDNLDDSGSISDNFYSINDYMYSLCLYYNCILIILFIFRGKILSNWKSRMDHDGLNSLVYNVTSYDLKPLYTLISVDVDQKAIMKKFQTLGELDRK